VIVWDLYPPWRDARPCRWEDRETILRSLEEADIMGPEVALVCNEEELEAWLLADGRALSSFLSTAAHPVKVQDAKKPTKVHKQKTLLNQHCQKNSGRSYVDRIDAIKILRHLPDLTRIRKSQTFRRFEEKVTD